MTKLHLFLILPLLLSSCEIFNRGTKISLADYQSVRAKYEAAAEADNLGDGADDESREEFQRACSLLVLLTSI